MAVFCKVDATLCVNISIFKTISSFINIKCHAFNRCLALVIPTLLNIDVESIEIRWYLKHIDPQN